MCSVSVAFFLTFCFWKPDVTNYLEPWKTGFAVNTNWFGLEVFFSLIFLFSCSSFVLLNHFIFQFMCDVASSSLFSYILKLEIRLKVHLASVWKHADMERLNNSKWSHHSFPVIFSNQSWFFFSWTATQTKQEISFFLFFPPILPCNMC